jgi:radical SAM superfamily enzyme YgiQ (UPF0313 family)
MALVLQVTEGCSFNTCTFCTLYKDRIFRIKSPQELRAHIHAGRAFLGESALLRRGVFLADANALVVPQRQLLPLVDMVIEECAADNELFAFLDGFSGTKKSIADYAALADRGLSRCYIGLESGHDPLLEWVRKPGHAADALETVRRIKAGGINVAVIILLGIGGSRYQEGHVRDTIRVLNQMGLARGDLIYFSEFVPDGSLYETNLDGPDLTPLTRPEMRKQRNKMARGLRFEGERPQIANYDIREFIY